MPVAAIQLCDPSRRYEALGAPKVTVVQSVRLLGAGGTTVGGSRGAGRLEAVLRLDGSDLEAVTTRAHQGQPEDGHQASASPVELGSGEAEKKAGPA
uniref:Uncharacterized protein n=1 Tax=Oryza rufipogon TaxID=4529 RepID=A0A0E0RJM9_ORYRU